MKVETEEGGRIFQRSGKVFALTHFRFKWHFSAIFFVGRPKNPSRSKSVTLSVNESLYDLLLQVAKDGRFGANVAEVAGRFVSDQLIALVKDGTLIRMEPLILHSKTPPSSSSSTANPA